MIAEAHIFTTFAMTGVIWLVQLAHYPNLHVPGASAEYFERNASRTGYVVVPLMLVEAATAAALLFIHRDALYLILALLLAAIWLSTAVFSVPCHNQLCKTGYSKTTVTRLVRTNWPRTLLWTTRSTLLLATTS